jgi:hypothetical protein
MRQRGRKSAAAQAAVVIAGGFGTRPEPPADLTPRQGDIWREIVGSEDPNFFNTGALRGLLAAYCRHREAYEGISAIINGFDPQWLKASEGAKRYKDLLKMRDLETRGATSLATKLRLTNQSRYTEKTSATAARNALKGPRPWEM